MAKKKDKVGGGVVNLPTDYSDLKGAPATEPPERLTVSIEGGTTHRLRSLAGGERKVGAFLSDVVSWLYGQREALEAAPLSSYVLCDRETAESVGELQTRLVRMDNTVQEIERQFRENAVAQEALQAQIDAILNATKVQPQ